MLKCSVKYLLSPVRDSGYSDNPELAPNCHALAHCQAYLLHFTDILAHRQVYSE